MLMVIVEIWGVSIVVDDNIGGALTIPIRLCLRA